ncbi:MAG: pirin-related protein [Verrucomicrobiales bacterium]|nr:pirin-related protein [Verrucomicrobiales bacterium]
MKTNSPTTHRIVKRPSAARGHADHGWLKTQHSFSFADYYDPAHMNFRSLRVINEDHVDAGRGFGTHPHRDMEIFSYVLAGSMAHKDSMGNGRTLLPGQIQLMSAGSGVTHSEFNPDTHKDLHLLQIWIMPEKRNLTPSYTEWHPKPESDADPKVLVISPDGRDDSATIHQDAHIYRLRLQSGESIAHHLAPGRGLWIQVMRGSLTLDGEALIAGDGASSEDEGDFEIRAINETEALLFDLK